jgi:bifunctional DNase/RNase
MIIDSIRVSLMNYQRVIILREKEADRFLPIWIGPAEADAIAVKLQNVAVPRPLTHDLLGSVISNLGGTVSYVVVSDLQNDTFFAKVIINVDGRAVEIDSRPSDAIALAVRTKAVLYAEDSVLEKAGIVMDKETGKPVIPYAEAVDGEGAAGKEVQEDELRRLSAYKDFIDTLDLEDFGKPKAG